jgi:cytoskeletal protein CcmA (bactofilin family)
MSVFNKKSKAIDQQAISTLISEGCVIDGNIKAPNFVRIDGHVNGDVRIEEGLILGEKGIITGNICTREMIVYGAVNGNIQTDSLKIQSTGKINGEIATQTLQVEMGAVYNGRISTNGSASATEKPLGRSKVLKADVEELQSA